MKLDSTGDSTTSVDELRGIFTFDFIILLDTSENERTFGESILLDWIEGSTISLDMIQFQVTSAFRF